MAQQGGIDYASLAKQQGGTTDYAALAKSLGGNADAPKQQPQSSGGSTIEERLKSAAANGDKTAQAFLTLIDYLPVNTMLTKHERSALPMAGAIGATALTGGGALPAIAAAGAGGTVGRLAQDSFESMPLETRAMNALKSGGSQAVMQGVGELASAVAPAMMRGARSLWNRSAKITEPIAKTTQAMKSGGTLMDAKNEIADTVLSQGRGTLTKGNLDALKGTLNELDDALDTVIAGSTGMVSRQELRNALQAKSQAIGTGSLAQEAQQSALAKAFDLLKTKPPKMTVQEAQKFKRAIYQAYEKTFAAGATDAALAMADKTTAKALRGAIAREVPEASAINAQMSRQIPAVKAVETAISRGSNRDLVGLSQMLAGAVTNPLTVASALVNHPTISSFTAQQIYRAASMLPTNGRTVANILRAAKALLGGDE